MKDLERKSRNILVVYWYREEKSHGGSCPLVELLLLVKQRFVNLELPPSPDNSPPVLELAGGMLLRIEYTDF